VSGGERRPRVTVAGVIERAGKFLLVEEEIEKVRVLNQPAGHWESGETLVEGCVREVLEETAHRIRPTALVGIYRWHSPARNITYLRFAFAGEVEAVEERALDRTIVRALWLSPEEIGALASRHRSPLVMRCVHDFLAGHRYPLELLSEA
jgi:ADP-ribose pyrophosphatase YjhB (NUDIX family)